ncbi:MAG: dockerin type I repeat-containing protein [Ruminococcus sp.]|nr:dockerin type I repeat-containing protein [Ruminococcus sp.]
MVTDDETEPLLYGDVNLDSTVSLADAVKLIKAIAGSVELNETATSSADTNGNGDLEQEDALILLKFLVQYIDTIPVTE